MWDSEDLNNWREITTGVPQEITTGAPQELTAGAPQGSVLLLLLGLLLLLIIDIFLYVDSSNACNYANDKTLFAFWKTFDEVTRKLQNDSLILDRWFFNSFLVLNSDKCQDLETANTLPNFKYHSITIKNIASKKLLGVINDNKLDLCTDN